jgi:hypothetical protein
VRVALDRQKDQEIFYHTEVSEATWDVAIACGFVTDEGEPDCETYCNVLDESPEEIADMLDMAADSLEKRKGQVA